MSEQHDELIVRIDENVKLLRQDLLGGPGVKGKIPEHNERIADLEAHKNRAIGYAAAIGGVVTLGLAAFEYVKHLKP